MVALAIAIPVFYSFTAIPEGSFLKPFDLGIILLSVVLVQAWWSNPTILFSGNPAAWTLTCEAFFYALHPWISRGLVRVAQRGALLLAVGVIAYAFLYRIGVHFWPDSWLPAVPLPVQRLPEFVLGMALAWAMRSGWRPRIHPIIGVGSLGAVILVIMVSNRYLSDIPILRALPVLTNELFTVACGLAIVALAAYSLRGKKSILESKIQVKLGEWSFAFYLVHATFIYIAMRVFGHQAASWGNLVWFLPLLAVDLVAAWALHSFVERPMERRMRRWKDRRDLRKKEGAAPLRADR